MAQQTLTAFFDSRSDATQAIEKLVQAGIARTAIRLLPEQEGPSTTTRSSYDYNSDDKGFWASLGDLFIPEEDRVTYAEGMHRGGTTVSVTVDASHMERAADILEENGSVDLDERESTWRKEGWAGYAASQVKTSGAAGTRGAAMDTDKDREVIPIVEERLQVGKREVVGGRVKVRSYVVETPVEEQVSLRSEHVQVERRPVDRPARADEDFRDRSIEAEERSEEAVVSKSSRVKEEVVVNKTADQRTETVSDTVRRTEVEVDDDRTNRSSTRTAGATNPVRRP